MTKTKISRKCNKLYTDQVARREALVAKYESNGEIHYDDAVGIIANKAFVESAYNQALENSYTEGQELRKTIDDYTEDGRKVGTRFQLDFDAIRENNGDQTMREAFDERARDKVVLLPGDAISLNWGGVLLFDTPCMVKITSTVNNIHWRTVLATDSNSEGVVHAINSDGRDKIEERVLQHRAQFKPHLHRGDGDWSGNPVSMWATEDSSRQSIFMLGNNSIIRMWGENQVVDLNGFEVSHHSRPNIVAGFASVFDLSDGHFAGLATQGCKNCHIFSSKPGGRIGRSNHFALRGHFVDGLLVENILVGNAEAQNKGTYFGVSILNQSKNIVFKKVIQEQTNQHVTRSSLGLNWYSVLTMHEMLFAKNITSEAWDQVIQFGPGPGAPRSELYPWLKWDVDKRDPSTGGTTTPIINQSYCNGVDPSGKLLDLLMAAQEAYRASSKNADDQNVQVNAGLTKNAVNPKDDITSLEQLFRTTNLTTANPVNREEHNMYPDSTVYGFRAGSNTIGTGNLASERVDKWSKLAPKQAKNIYLIDCEFNGMAFSMTEAPTMYDGSKVLSGAGGIGLRPLGYSNIRNPAASIAAQSMIFSKESIQDLACLKDLKPSNTPESHPIFALDTARKVSENLTIDDTSYDSYSGVYKGNDVLEAALANSTALRALQAHPSLSFNPILSGVASTDKLDVGVLAWRQSCMDAIGASTACHVGLKGGYHGDVVDRELAEDNEKFDGEIYPWYRSYDRSDTITYNCVKLGKEYYSSNRGLDFGDERSSTTGHIITPTAPTRFTIKNSDRSDFTDESIDLTVNFATTPRRDGTRPVRVISDKDRDYYAALALDPVSALRSNLTEGYFHSLTGLEQAFRFKLSDGKMRLVKPDGSDVKLRDCTQMLGLAPIADSDASGDETFEYTLLSNADGQNHSAKGMFGVRMDQVSSCGLFNVKIEEVENTGLELDQHLSVTSDEAFNSGLSDPARPGRRQNDFHGVSINGCTDVVLSDIVVDDAITLGEAKGIEVRAQSKNVYIDGVIVDNVTAGQKYGEEDVFNSNTQVTGKPCIGVRVATDCEQVCVKDVSVRNISSSATSEVKALSIEAPDSFDRVYYSYRIKL